MRGGSVSVSSGGAELDYWIGTREVSKSEDVLEQIEKLLERNDFRKRGVERVVVSRGPGSYTGARIGMAVGIGLSKALGCELLGVSVLEVMLSAVGRENTDSGKEIITAVPIGRNQVCRQSFKVGEAGATARLTQPLCSTFGELFECCGKNALLLKKTLVLQTEIYLEMRKNYESLPAESGFKNCILIDAGENLAAFVGMNGMGSEGSEILQPIYVRDESFLP